MRFDATEEDVPESGQEVGVELTVTPSLFLIKRNPFRVVPYSGKLKASSLVKWIEHECDYVDKAR
jgi:hypothetical protein